ncbi:heparinase II/III family protein [Streptomyces sp. VRA16 Mangrove soil]|uniref:heparinase II/III domain-containing protein n=1 Tax=Streptomyces sp. VRA16 Mangrove soil TaxID=2817434 RepID=UPI001A9F9F64|nr:heparinase II/III family protein [Streptomyces sp. VRA16 Mangrove soil]MBO1331428.1 heparinase II/III family protein [Streptomyces sp. VRA16 Mangrove soil]
MPGPLGERLAPLTDAGLERLLSGRVGVPDVTDRDAWDGVPEPLRERVLADAARELKRPAPLLSAHAWARAFRDGNRGAYEDAAWGLQERVSLLTLAAVLTGECADATDPAPGACPHLDAVVDGLMAFAEASTWCWAAHDRFTAGRGEVVPDPDDPYLDLGAAEVTALFAWADHALGPHLDRRAPGLRRRLRREVERRALGPFERRADWPWIGREKRANNWNPWVHGAVLAAALLLCEDRARRARLVRRVADGLDHYLRVLPDDGGIDEGISYWWAGACRLLEILDLLAQAAGPALDVRELPLLAELLKYPRRMHLGADRYVNVGDAPARLDTPQPWQVAHRWGLRLGQRDTVAHALAGALQQDCAAPPRAGLGRALTALADPVWCRAVTGPPPEPVWPERETWLPRLQILVAREAAGSTDGLTVAVKAGHNGEHHNHLDVGSYWLAVHGRPLLVDVGRPTYTTRTFGPDRYAAWPFRSRWHNVPDPGAEQLPGADHGARGVRAELGPDVSRLSMELSGAYPPGTLARWDRTVLLVRGATPYVEVEDAWQGCSGEVALHHVLAGHVELDDGRATVTAPDGTGALLCWDARVAEARVVCRELDDPQLTRSWGGRLTRLTLAVRDPGSQGRLRIRWLVAAAPLNKPGAAHSIGNR